MAGHLPRCWEELPEVLLNQISHNLSSLQDRASAARVAKSWRDALDNPALWRNIRGTMTGKARGSKDNQIIKFLDIHMVTRPVCGARVPVCRVGGVQRSTTTQCCMPQLGIKCRELDSHQLGNQTPVSIRVAAASR